MLGFLWIIQKDIQSPQPAARSPQPAVVAKDKIIAQRSQIY
jgi:hypothetical protein